MTKSARRNLAGSSEAAPASLVAVSETEAVRILVIEDNHSHRQTLTDALSEQGFAVQSFDGGIASPLALDAAVDIDVVVLDWHLPSTSGIDLLANLRQQGINVPLVLVTDVAQLADNGLAFAGEASDFAGRSRGVDLLARHLGGVVKTLKRADQPRPDKAMLCGSLILRSDVNRAYWNEVDLKLTLGEYNIVHLLASNEGRYVSYRKIYDRLHHEGFIAGRGALGYLANVRSAIKRIRDKFRAIDPTFDKIENYSNFGYRWRTSIVCWWASAWILVMHLVVV